MLLLAQRGFTDYFSRPEKTSISGSDFINFSKCSSSYLVYNLVIVKVILLLHLDKIVPLDFYLLDFEVLLIALRLIFLLLFNLALNGSCWSFCDLLNFCLDMSFSDSNGFNVLENCFASRSGNNNWLGGWPWHWIICFWELIRSLLPF